MSYILDALKKSEQQRQGDPIPNVQSLQRPAVTRGSHRQRVWPLVIVAVLLGNGVLLGGFWWLQRSDATPQAEDKPTTTPSVAEAATPIPQKTDASPVPGAAVSPRTVERLTPASSEPPPVQALWELPDPVRARLPALTYSFHVYSSDPSRRAIIINGRRMQKGGEIAPDLRLEAITEDGVILAFEDRRVRVQVLEGW